jgi:hypothetical protein
MKKTSMPPSGCEISSPPDTSLQEMSMNATSETSFLRTWADSLKPTSSLASEYGLTHSSDLAGWMIEKYGQEAVLANLSARQAKELGLLTSDTFGQRSTISSASASLTLSLANRLRHATASVGSRVYRLTWKLRAMPSGRSIPALRGLPMNKGRKASTSASASTGLPSGWATPTTETAGGGNVHLDKQARLVDLAGWPTPMAGTPAQNGNNEAGNTDSSRKTVALIGSSAKTGSTGRLRAGHSRWLMRIPSAWDACAPTETPSMLRKRKASLKP